jgi:opacity protein-like surface antigen
MKRIIIALLFLVAAPAFADIHANNGFYLGGGVAQISLSDSSYDWTALELVGGYKLNPFVGGEVRLGAASEGDPNITSYMSGYYRVESANDVGKTYLLAGYTYGAVSGDSSDNFSGFSYGGGVGFVIFETLNLNFEYRILCKDNKNNLDFSSFNVGVDYRF